MPNRAAASLCLLVFTAVRLLDRQGQDRTGQDRERRTQHAGPAQTAAQTASDTGGAGNTPAPTGGVACGPKTCPAGQVCCNESCGICTEPGGFCTQQFCEPEGGCKQDSRLPDVLGLLHRLRLPGAGQGRQGSHLQRPRRPLPGRPLPRQEGRLQERPVRVGGK